MVYLVYVTYLYLDYVVGVINEITTALGIWCFRIHPVEHDHKGNIVRKQQ